MSTVLSKHPVYPLSNVNAQYVNVDNSHSPGNFGSNATGLEFGLPALRNNVNAANASQMAGGRRKTLRKKIKNIIHKYRMPRKNRIITRRKLRSLYKRSGSKRRRHTKKRSHKRSGSKRSGSRRGMYGGRYMQYGSDIPNTPSYSTGGILAAKDLGLANPIPYQGLPCTTNCVDNYNYNTNKGFQV